VTRFTNLKHIYDAVSIFLVEECERRLPLITGRPDLKAIAQNADEDQTILLLKLLVVAAINCANRLQYLEDMQNLDISTQEVLMMTAQEAGEEPDDDLPLDAEPEEEPAYMSSPRSNRASRQSKRDSFQELPSSHPGGDAGLESEERLGHVIADNQRIAQEKRELQRQLDTLYDHHTKLQQRHDKTSDELVETKDRLTSILAGKTEYGNSKSQDSAQSAVITTLEARLAASEAESSTLRKNSEVLRIRAEKTQSLQDSYDELKISHDKLLRKANAADKYKQKLEASQSLETENNSLKTKIADLQTQLKQSDSASVGQVDLRREIDEYRRLLPAIEQERHELNEMKKRLEFEYHALEARHQDALEQLRRQNSTVEELQGRLQDYEEGNVPNTPRTNGDAIPDIESSDEEQENEDPTREEKDENDLPAEDTISETELSAIMTAMRAQANATSDRKLSRMLEKGVGRYQKVVDHARKQSMMIKDLQGQIGSAEKSAKEEELEREKEKEKEKDLPPLPPLQPATPPAPKNEMSCDQREALESQLETSEKTVENLRREIKLMSSAWYEQNSRVMQGGMGRRDGGRVASSFLGRARKDVGNVMLTGGEGRPMRR
jgi:protein HOOK3